MLREVNCHHHALDHLQPPLLHSPEHLQPPLPHSPEHLQPLLPHSPEDLQPSLFPGSLGGGRGTLAHLTPDPVMWVLGMDMREAGEGPGPRPPSPQCPGLPSTWHNSGDSGSVPLYLEELLLQLAEILTGLEPGLPFQQEREMLCVEAGCPPCQLRQPPQGQRTLSWPQRPLPASDSWCLGQCVEETGPGTGAGRTVLSGSPWLCCTQARLRAFPGCPPSAPHLRPLLVAPLPMAA